MHFERFLGVNEAFEVLDAEFVESEEGEVGHY